MTATTATPPPSPSTAPTTRGALTDPQCRSAVCPAERKTIKLWDGRGLYLEVSRAGGRVFRFGYTRHGRQRTLTLGSYGDISLSRARRLVSGYRANMDVDPAYDPAQAKSDVRAAAQARVRQTAQESELFRDSAEHFFRKKIADRKWVAMPDDLRQRWLAGQPLPSGLKHPQSTEHRHRDRVRRHLFPALGDVPTARLEARQLANVINRIEAGSEREKSLELLRGIVGSWHRRQPHGTPDPLYALTEHLTFERHIPGNFASLVDPHAFGLMVRDVRLLGGFQNLNPVACFFSVQVYLWQRAGALVRMRWRDIDFQNAIWNCPIFDVKTSNMGKLISKKRIDQGFSDGYYKIPLSTQITDLLEKIRPFKTSDEFVFANSRGNPLTGDAVRQLFKRAGYGGRQTLHGIRAAAKSILDERFEVSHRVIEAQLGHELEKFGWAYQRAEFLTKRRNLVQGWSDLVDWLAAGKNIEQFNSKYLVKTPRFETMG